MTAQPEGCAAHAAGQPQLVSVIITNHNYGRYVGAAIESALGQTYASVEVIVVDDGSTDDSRAVIGRYADRLTPLFCDRGGQPAAFNRGFAASKGRIICFLDADDRFLPTKVEAVVAVLAQHPEAVACFHARSREVDGMLTHIPLGRSGIADEREAINSGNPPYIPTVTSGIALRREVMTRLVPLPDAWGTGVQDHPIKWGPLAVGQVSFLDESLAIQVIHGRNASEVADDQDRIQNLLANALYFAGSFPELHRLCERLFLEAVALAARAGAVSRPNAQDARAFLFGRPRSRRGALLLRAAVAAARPMAAGLVQRARLRGRRR